MPKLLLIGKLRDAVLQFLNRRAAREQVLNLGYPAVALLTPNLRHSSGGVVRGLRRTFF